MNDLILPIPSHLQGILVPYGTKNTENSVSGTLHCSCGCGSFRVGIFADMTKGFPQTKEYNGDFALAVNVVCTQCGNEILVFDSGRHGWNGYVCHYGVSVPPEELKPYSCRKNKCGGESHGVTVHIQSEGKRDFIENLGVEQGETEFNANEWVNAFSWITVGLKCASCGCENEGWIDYETM
jgi:ribosomal protein S27E